MNLYLLRHAEAEQEAASDGERQLTERGRGQARTRLPTTLRCCSLVMSRTSAGLLLRSLDVRKNLSGFAKRVLQKSLYRSSKRVLVDWNSSFR